jgi:hypothetical protein
LMQARNLVFVFGVGRSGTSALSEVLHRSGLRIGDQLVPPSEQNRRGAWEDQLVIDLHRNLYAELGVTPFYPLPRDWQKHRATRNAREAIRDLVSRAFSQDDSPFLIKDPALSSFLPVWKSVCNSTRVVPHYILCIREPGETISSLIRSYSVQQERAETLWLLRTLSSIIDTSASAVVVDYKELFGDVGKLGQRLVARGLPIEVQPFQLAAEAVLQPDLNRSFLDPVRPDNPLIPQLYGALTALRDGNSSREDLFSLARQIEAIASTFEWWANGAAAQRQRIESLQASLQSQVKEVAGLRTEAERAAGLEAENRMLRAAALAIQMTSSGNQIMLPYIHQQLTILTRRVSELSGVRNKIPNARAPASKSLTSVSKRVGRLVKRKSIVRRIVAFPRVLARRIGVA